MLFADMEMWRDVLLRAILYGFPIALLLASVWFVRRELKQRREQIEQYRANLDRHREHAERSEQHVARIEELLERIATALEKRS